MLAYYHGWGFASVDVRPVREIMEVAEEEARRAIELDPDDATAQAVLSWASMSEGDYDAALERAERDSPLLLMTPLLGWLRDASWCSRTDLARHASQFSRRGTQHPAAGSVTCIDNSWKKIAKRCSGGSKSAH